MKSKCFGLLILMCSCSIAWGQTRKVTGQVTKENSTENVAGVSVTVKGTNTATSTNSQGNFTINIPDRNDVVLVFSSVGFMPKEINAGNNSTINVSLPEQASSLSDVVIVGYSPMRRRDLTGSVSSVNAKQLKDIPLSNAAEALTGKLAGVQVTTSEGAPGADVLIRVRGGGSITQDNAPIYVVDGIQMENALQFLSPQDIASVDVLKDASTTAIYGARGANGVVIITTKSGRAGKTLVSYNGSAGFREIFKKMEVLNPYDFVLLQYERARLTSDTNFNKIYGSTWDTLNVYKNIPFIDWQEETFGRKAIYQNHNVAVSGGSQNTTFNLSLTSNKEEGIQLESGFNRKLVNFKLDHKDRRLAVGMTARYIDQRIDGAGTTTSGTRTTNRLRNSIQYRPFEIPTVPSSEDFDEDYYRLSANISNPVILSEAEYKKAYTKGTNLSGYFSYNILKNLTFRSTAGWDNTYTRQDQFYSKITSTARNFASLPVAMIGEQYNTTINNSNTLSYNNKIGEKQRFDVLLGQEIYETRAKNLNIETRFFPADISAEKALANMSLGAPPSGSTLQQARPTTSETPPSRILSFFGRVNYDYDRKILASFSLRGDRSTKFKYETGLLVFPSASVAYRFTEDKFLDGITWLTEGKIRAGFGTAGNNRIGDLLYLQLYGVNGEYALNHSVLPGFAPSALANENLKWEKTASRNIGLDLGFLNNRIQFTMDVYKNKGNDLLLAVAIPPVSGYTSQLQNVGSTSNTGMEFQVNANIIQQQNFNWTSNFNISFNKNKVVSLGGLTQQTRNSGWQGSDGADDYLVKVGEPVGLMYGFVSDGFYAIDDFNYNATTQVYTLKTGVANAQNISGTVRPGTMKIKDINKDGQITTDGDRAIIGHANPKFAGGWNNQFSYKSFDLSLFLNFVVGNDIYNANKIEWTDGSFPNLNTLAIMKDRWKNINDLGQLVTDPAVLAKLNEHATMYSTPSAQRYFLRSDAIEDGSFLRVNNLTLGYTLPRNVLGAIKISQFRVYATVNNLATFTNYSGYDPEVSARRNDPLTPGVDFAAYPRSRAWVFGLNLTF